MTRIREQGRLHITWDKYTAVFGIMILLSLLLRILLTGRHLSTDYIDHLLPWVTNFRELGVIDGMLVGKGDYYVPYNLFLAWVSNLPLEPYIPITALSVLFEYIAAVYVYKLAYELCGITSADRTKMYRIRLSMGITVLYLFLPTGYLDSAIWQQCDSIYTCFLLMALYYAVKERYNKAFICMGLGFAFKLQAVFLLPLFILLYLAGKKFSILHFLWIPACYLAAGLPAILIGRPAVEVYSTYFNQVGEYMNMNMNMMNLYTFITDAPNVYRQPAMLITIMVFVLMALWCHSKKKGIQTISIVYLAIWSVWTCNMFLPSMHERYDYLAAMLVPIFFITVGRKQIWLACGYTIISALTYCNYVFQWAMVVPWVYAAAMIGLYLYGTWNMMGYIKGEALLGST